MIAPNDQFALVTDDSRIRQINLVTFEVTSVAGGDHGFLDGVGTIAKFDSPHGIAIFNSMNTLYSLVADTSNNKIRKIHLTTHLVSTLEIPTTTFSSPKDICVSSFGQFALVTDPANNVIRMINLTQSPLVTSVFTTGVSTDISLSPDNTYALVANSTHIRKIIISTKLIPQWKGNLYFSFSGKLFLDFCAGAIDLSAEYSRAKPNHDCCRWDDWIR